MEAQKVKIGQVWKDNDKRVGDRYLKVVDLDMDCSGAKCILVPCRADGQAISSRTTRILISRMRPTASGFTLIKDVG